ncbi:MAG: GNAT family N-acetyltransferase [Anaerolineales bacterium]|nr:MAG: GNAT family N-acetyltransferase [Anaerolineales bacterium]
MDGHPARGMVPDAKWRGTMKDILKGELVRLSAMDMEEMSKAFSFWSRDTEFRRLLDSGAAHVSSQNAVKKWLEKGLDEQSINMHWFSIRKLDDDRLLGDIDLYVNNWPGREAFVGLGIGEREFWGRGYGTDVMKVILRYGFTEVNLNRVTLVVFEYNPRAIRSYEKAGFRHEGRMRKVLNREGRRWDMLTMGILREEWMEQNGYKITN